METILQILCDTCIKLPEGFYKQDSIAKHQQKIDYLAEKLKAVLNEDEQNLLYDLIEEVNQFCSYESYEYFCQGVRCGVQLYDEVKEVDVSKLFKMKLDSK